mmetsp:Transcript_71327/g.168124  ORF Transcript_71327/g.168124 Transcript_71327/m.168124 type:complete len:101 (-) Transcript_71327:194-496(-)
MQAVLRSLPRNLVPLRTFAVKARRERPPPIKVSDSAAARIKELIHNKETDGVEPVGIRLGVRTRGCNGKSYVMNYVEEPDKFDEVVKDKGPCLATAPTHR